MAKIVFFGTPEFAVTILEALAKQHDIALVVTAPDKPVGRHQLLAPCAVASTALKLGLTIFKPKLVNEVVVKLDELKPDLIVVAAFGRILSSQVLEGAGRGAINVHPSLLPKYRGASPIQSAIFNGEIETGTTIMLMNEMMDEGDIIAQIKHPIKSETDFPTLSGELSALSAGLLTATIPKFLSGQLKPMTQDNAAASYCKLLTKEDGRIIWTKTAEEIERMIRAFRPWPGAFTTFNYKLVKILRAEVVIPSYARDLEPGQILGNDRELWVGCRSGTALRLNLLQHEGRQPITGPEFLEQLKGDGHQFI